ncbi:hypothetical protein BSKO_04367 [Bryopsis sp. KO-2023]|nr:hypothetical protein BSKO_04367 [Bryopsis sp. KO-2023]
MLDPQDFAQLADFLLEKGLVDTERALRKESCKWGSNSQGSFGGGQNGLPGTFWSFQNSMGGYTPSTPGSSPPSSGAPASFPRTKSLPASPVQASLGGKVPLSAPASFRSSSDLGRSATSSPEEALDSFHPPRQRKAPCFTVRPVFDKRTFQVTELQLEDTTEESDRAGTLSCQSSPFKSLSQSSGADVSSSPATSFKGGEHGLDRGLSPVFELMPPVVPEETALKDVDVTIKKDAPLSRVDSLSESQEISDSLQILATEESVPAAPQGDTEEEQKDPVATPEHTSFDFCPVKETEGPLRITPPQNIVVPTSKENDEAGGATEGGGGFSFPLTPRSEDENEPIFAGWQSFSRCSGDLGSVSSLARAFSIEGGASSVGEGQGKEECQTSQKSTCPSNVDEWEVMLAHQAKEAKTKEAFLMSTGGSYQTGADPSMCASSEAGGNDIDGGGCYLDTCHTYSYSEDYVNSRYDIIDLKIYHKRGTTGFETSKELHMEQGDVVAGRYQVQSVVGTAAFSQAVEAFDLKENIPVCLKMVKNNKDFFDQSLDEIKLLRFINAQDPCDEKGVVRMYDFFYYKEHLFLVFELLHSNLYEVQKKYLKNRSEPYYFTMWRIQSIAGQILRSLVFLHELKIIHSDLKPENILIKSMDPCEVKVIDLGSSCFTTDYLGSYVQSRSYRAPEVILGLAYDQKIDIWSLGCVLAELASGHVLLQSNSLAALLARVESCRGPIPREMVMEGSSSHKFFTNSGRILRETQSHEYEILVPTPVSLGECIPGADAGFLKFLSVLLTVDPHERASAAEALAHPWLQHDYGNNHPNKAGENPNKSSTHPPLWDS